MQKDFRLWGGVFVYAAAYTIYVRWQIRKDEEVRNHRKAPFNLCFFLALWSCLCGLGFFQTGKFIPYGGTDFEWFYFILAGFMVSFILYVTAMAVWGFLMVQSVDSP